MSAKPRRDHNLVLTRIELHGRLRPEYSSSNTSHMQILKLLRFDGPGAPVIRSVPLAVLGKAMQSRMLVRPE